MLSGTHNTTQAGSTLSIKLGPREAVVTTHYLSVSRGTTNQQQQLTVMGSRFTTEVDELVRGLRQKGDLAPRAGCSSSTLAQVAVSAPDSCFV